MLGNSKLVMAGCAARTFTTSTLRSASHYDILGLTPRATQADIKSAYYKLSMLYHPDKSTDIESAKKFRAITEAYEVLGNIKLKKLYDKGLIVGRDNISTRMSNYTPEEEPTDPVLKFYKSHEKRHMTPTMDGKTPIYDFDKWAKQHYGETLKKQHYEKSFIKMRKAKTQAEVNAERQESIIYIFLIVIALFGYCVVKGPEDYDRIEPTSLEPSNVSDTMAPEGTPVLHINDKLNVKEVLEKL